MKRYQLMTEDEIKNAILCAVDKISCTYCPAHDDCVCDGKEIIGTNCSSKIIKNIIAETEDIPPLEFPVYKDGFADGYNAAEEHLHDTIETAHKFAAGAYNRGWDDGRRHLVRQIEERAGIIREERKKK